MNTIKLLALGSLFISGLATAAPACSEFELKLKNNLVDDLLVTSIKLDGAEISPSGVQKIDKKLEQVFTVKNANADTPMIGEFTLRTLSFPNKKVKIRYSLENKGLVCEHTQIDTDSDIPVSKTRGVNKVEYTINP